MMGPPRWGAIFACGGDNAAMDLPALHGAVATLRPLLPADAPSLQRHADDPQVACTLFDGFPQPYTIEEAQAWCADGWRSRGHVWGIVADGEVVGCIGLRVDAGWLRCNAEVGYWVGRAYWGRGLASDALALGTGWAFANLSEVTRVYAPIFDWNAASQAVARKAGYVLEGKMPMSAIKDGRVIGRVVYATYRVR